MPVRPVKEFHEYLVKASHAHLTHDDYVESPATSFLRYTLDAKDAVNTCLRYFSKGKDGNYSKDALAGLQHISLAMLPAIMGHFEMFQRSLFSGVFELSPYLRKFSIDVFFKNLSKITSLEIDLSRLSAYRGQNAPVGIVIADNLPGWNSPWKVNSYFRAFDLNVDFYSHENCRELEVLWQLRHSIVHTGGTITIPDAQKLSCLGEFAGQTIVFQQDFIMEVSRKLHPLVKECTNRIEAAVRGKAKLEIPSETRRQINKLFLVKSQASVWLR